MIIDSKAVLTFYQEATDFLFSLPLSLDPRLAEQEQGLFENFARNQLKALALNHFFNAKLWIHEDKARDPKAQDNDIAQVKRSIDGFNQKRNDFIEGINQFIVEKRKPMNQESPLFSETPGSILDRLSIQSLKKYHYQKIKSREKEVLILDQQIQDLGQALDHLLEETDAGRMHFKIYRQLKMYNDSSLNPYFRS